MGTILWASVAMAFIALPMCEMDPKGRTCTINFVKFDAIILAEPPTFQQQLIFKNALITRMPVKIISQFTNLQKLDLSGNSFTELVFTTVSDTLKILDMSKNNITELDSNVFAKTTKLQEVYLSRNNISVLPSTVFFPLTSLTLVDISHNQIKTINADNLFGFARNLKFIYLNNNFLTKLRTSFANVSNLVEVDASHNNLLDWSLTFAGGSSVKLNLAYCGLKNAYSSAADKEELNLEGNAIEVMKITGRVVRLRANNNVIRQVDINPEIQLEALEMANNFITDISNITKVSKLQVLDVSGNRLRSSIKDDVFAELPELTYLSLRNTDLTSITETLFMRNTRLVYLDLGGNRMGNFDIRLLRYLSNLEILKLDSIEMAELVGFEDIKEYLPELSSIQIDNNMFSCSYLAKLISTLKGLSVDVSVSLNNLEYMFPNVRGIKCINDGGNTTSQLVSLENVINTKDDSYKDLVKQQLRSIADGLSDQKRTINSQGAALQDASSMFGKAMELQNNTGIKINKILENLQQNSELLDKVSDVQGKVDLLQKFTNDRLDKIVGSMNDNPVQDKLISDTRDDFESLQSKMTMNTILIGLGLICLCVVLGVVLKDKLNARLEAARGRSYSQQNLVL